MENGVPQLKHLVFCYGTLKVGQPNYYHMTDASNGQARFVGSATTEVPYPLIVSTRFNLPFLVYAKGKGKKVTGEVFEVDDKMLSFMDEFEGHPDVYHRDWLRVELLDTPDNPESTKPPHVINGACSEDLKKSSLSCWCYFLKRYPPQIMLKPPYTSYEVSGAHGCTYVEDDDDIGPENIFDALVQECLNNKLL